jgi:2,4-dienoyl-CoA reductase-like NADH-dependent reductase (Old Yellow Enzyme family)/thioredoxin reductase
MGELRHLFSPLTVRNITLKNRIIFGPHVTNHWPNFTADDDTVAYYEERAKGGVGLIVIGSASIDDSVDLYPFNQPGLWSDEVVPRLAEIAEAVHQHGAKVFIQLLHPGLHHNPDRDRLHRPARSPSQIPDVGKPFYVPKELDVAEIGAIENRFADAAERAKSAGLDGVELHCAHGYLVNQFLTTLKNKRTDEYGGSLENRFRFCREIIEKVRRQVGDELVVGVRLNNNDMYDGGMGTEEYAQLAQMIEATGRVDYISVTTALLRSLPFLVPTHYSGLEPGYQTEMTSAVRAGLRGMPVFQVGRINNPALADWLIAEGRADAVVMIRELIAEPYFARKAQEGNNEDIRPCVYWNQGCVGRSNFGLRIECSLNPATAHERTFGADTLQPASRPKKVLIVGGGPAGMECARVAALRGHRVTVYEAESELGGQVREFAMLPRREEVRSWLDWLERQVEKAGVAVRLAHAVTSENVHSVLDAETPEAIVIASGARPARDGRSALTTEPIPGWEQDNVMTYEEVLDGGQSIGQRVLIIDEQGDRVSPGLAEMLGAQGKDVEIVTRWPNISTQWLSVFVEMESTYARLDNLNVKVTPNAWVQSIRGTTVVCYNVYSRREWEMETDNVVLVTMKYSTNAIYKLLAASGFAELHQIGDAVAPRWVSEATREGVRVAYAL